MNKSYIVLVVLAALVLSTLVYGFLDGGSPQAAKDRKFDETRTQDIQSIRSAINLFYSKNQMMPSTISQAESAYNVSSVTQNLVDPETKKEYSYTNLGGSKYQICANFALATSQDMSIIAPDMAHPAGHHCYSFDASRY